MPNEIEIKYQVKDFKAITAELQRHKAKFLGEFHEHDQFFDTAAGELMAADRGLRLRVTRTIKQGCGEEVTGRAGNARHAATVGGHCPPYGGAVPSLLTYKGPRRPDKKLKIRQEIQFHVGDAPATAAMLKALGYVPSIVVRKRRVHYALGGCSVLLDELRGIGRFVEVEGPSQRLVEATCRKLGLAGPTVTKSYARLTAEAKSR